MRLATLSLPYPSLTLCPLSAGLGPLLASGPQAVEDPQQGGEHLVLSLAGIGGVGHVAPRLEAVRPEEVEQRGERQGIEQPRGYQRCHPLANPLQAQRAVLDGALAQHGLGASRRPRSRRLPLLPDEL